jgi:hypothetical protein
MVALISAMGTYAYMKAPSPVLIAGVVPYSGFAIVAF